MMQHVARWRRKPPTRGAAVCSEEGEAGAQERDPGAVRRQAQAAAHRQRWQEALTLWTRLARDTASPLRDEARLRCAECLFQLGELHQARSLYAELVRDKLHDSAPMLGLAQIAQQELDWPWAEKCWQHLLTHYPDEPSLAMRYVGYLLARNAFAEAWRVHARWKGAWEPWSALLVAVDIHMAEGAGEKALSALEEAEKHAAPGDEVPARIILRKAACLASLRRYEQAVATIEASLTPAQMAPPAIAQLAEYLIGAGRPDEASRLIAAIPEDWHQHRAVANVMSWHALRQGEAEHARAIWHGVAFRPRIQLKKSMREPVDLVHRPQGVSGEGRLKLFAHLKDEGFRLPAFLDYYRALGVSEFYLIDNDSADDSRARLLAQDDVVTFATDKSFLDAQFGSYWINALMADHARAGDWCLYLDLDEFLVLPEIERNGLLPVLDRLDRAGDEALMAFMIDMYPETVRQGEAYDGVSFPLESSPYFDHDYRVWQTVQCPYRVVTGGAGERLFAKTPNPNLTKVPLIRAGRGIQFISSTHWITPAKVSRLSGALLHFKFIGGFRDNIRKDVRSKAVWEFNRNFTAYTETLNRLQEDDSFLGPRSVRYEGSEQLQQLGLIGDEV